MSQHLSRRKFVQLAAGGVAATAANQAFGHTPHPTVGKIKRIDLYPSRYPMTGYFKFFSGPDGSTGRACITIKVTTDQGVGWGQSIPIAKWSDETLETALAALKNYFAPALIGHQAENITENKLMWVGSGLTDPDISLAATLHLYTAFGLKKPAALNGPQFLTASILKEPISDKGGQMHCPSCPGLGVDVDEDALMELVKQSGHRRITIQ